MSVVFFYCIYLYMCNKQHEDHLSFISLYLKRNSCNNLSFKSTVWWFIVRSSHINLPVMWTLRTDRSDSFFRREKHIYLSFLIYCILSQLTEECLSVFGLSSGINSPLSFLWWVIWKLYLCLPCGWDVITPNLAQLASHSVTCYEADLTCI